MLMAWLGFFKVLDINKLLLYAVSNMGLLIAGL
jgi:hypothetical protein